MAFKNKTKPPKPSKPAAPKPPRFKHWRVEIHQPLLDEWANAGVFRADSEGAAKQAAIDQGAVPPDARLRARGCIESGGT